MSEDEKKVEVEKEKKTKEQKEKEAADERFLKKFSDDNLDFITVYNKDGEKVI